MKRKRRNGQAIVEMAILFPFFLLVIIGGIIDFGMSFYNFITLQQLVNDAALWAAESKGTEGRQFQEVSDFINAKKPSWWTGPFTVHPLVKESLTNGDQVVKVTVSYESPIYTPFYQTMVGATTGSDHLNLAALAAYKIPKLVVNR